MKNFRVQLVLFLLHCLLQSPMVRSIDMDRTALLAFKAGLANGLNVLNSWNESIHYCEWIGVTCSRKHPNRVSVLDLSMQGLLGTISPSIRNLTFLKEINLTSNELYGEIPSSLSFLHRLEYLDLSRNFFGGIITAGLQNCSNLVLINFRNNHLVGEIPSWIGSFSKLGFIYLSNNSLTGVIPLSLNNLSSLNFFSISHNHIEGTISEGLGFLPGLRFFQVAANDLSGTIPKSFANQSSLTYFVVAENKLEGKLPDNMGTNLPNLQTILIDGNHFSGMIPPSISNASSIIKIDLGFNNFSGQIPPELGKLCPLILSVEVNELEAINMEDWDFLRFLTNCSRLQVLGLGSNFLSGTFPSYVANLSTQLEYLYMSQNGLSGSIPNEIGNLANLLLLAVDDNQLTGVIPKSIGKLQQLEQLNLPGNDISGPLPTSMGNLTKCIYLYINNNRIQGSIPSSLANMQQLNYLDLSNNVLSGSLSPTILNISSLVYVNLSNNSLTGTLPVEVCNSRLGQLFLFQNKFYGELPEIVSNCESLEYLDLSANLFNGTIPPFPRSLTGLIGLNLSNNIFYGTIPQELSYMYSLQEMYLSHNNLSGYIPMSLENLSSLFILDLSFNHLEGPVPTKGIFNNISGLTISENAGLCGGIPQLHLPRCANQHNKKRNPLLFKILIVLSSIIIVVIALSTIGFVIYRRMKSREKQIIKSILLEDPYPKVSYAELVKATDNFSSANLLGYGSCGSVYKGNLPFKYKQTSYLAVKVFNLEVQGASKTFLTECDVLRTIRHRNLVSIITCCSSTDFKGNDFKALVLDLMPKGSLERWLHGERDRMIRFIERLNIAVDVADAVDYLHNYCEPPVIHCDLKPSNILLDEDFTAHVSDFGLAKLLPNTTNMQLINSQSSLGIRGSIGYVAPEYGEGGRVSMEADMYSFGIIILELFTGRRPVDDVFKDGLTLHTFVEMAFPEQLHDIVHPNMISLESDSDLEIQSEQYQVVDSWNKIQRFLVSVIRIGLMCSKQSATERKSIRDAALELHSIRDAYIKAQ